MHTPSKQSPLLEALARLELNLEKPVVPGEMVRWTTEVRRALEEVGPLLREVIEKEHPSKCNQISQEDPGLLRRVTQTKEQDQKSLEILDQIRARFEQLARDAETVVPDEARLTEAHQQGVNAGLAFVIHVRTQEASIDTWLMEALDRDRGIAD